MNTRIRKALLLSLPAIMIALLTPVILLFVVFSSASDRAAEAPVSATEVMQEQSAPPAVLTPDSPAESSGGMPRVIYENQE